MCGRRCPREDAGEGRRRWRALDLGTTLAFLEADAPRVCCKQHRVVVAAVPWARHHARCTVAFEDQCCWWAAPGREKATVEQFLDLLGKERCAQLELISCDTAESIAAAIQGRCPNAIRCVDRFHVIKLATDALDEIRREVWNQARREGHTHAARELKGARFALWKNPGKLTDRQTIKLAEIQQTNKPLYRADLISQQLRDIYRVSYQEAVQTLDAWLAWARR
ncbi:MAG TPA: transposase, partial [Solirubrobacteraceae bacterium]|nr:transposase [Solirubrobacteraceae bacterium]